MQRRIIWTAIAFSTLVYGIVAYATERNFTLQPLQLALRRPIVIVLYVVAVVIYLAALMTSGRSREGLPARDTADDSTRFVVQLALFDAVAILGLCAAFVIHDWRLYLPLWLLTLIGVARAYPAETAAR